jgi:hypothetical protein
MPQDPVSRNISARTTRVHMHDCACNMWHSLLEGPSRRSFPRQIYELPRHLYEESIRPPSKLHPFSHHSHLVALRYSPHGHLSPNQYRTREFSRSPAQKQYLASMTTSLTQAQPEASQSRPRNLLLLCPSRWLLPIGFQTLQTQPSTPRFNLCNPWLLPKCRDTQHVQSPSYIPRHETKPPPLLPSAIYSLPLSHTNSTPFTS